ncbi:heterokaryon incompatibility protein-domain-containing protein, partial [Epithele typhae]|uniref:heterokaryon incompatibility protein-domain-containing protein n=1 Tax=Epithele typhae TaxID=378194 RepID=UPI002008A50C
MWLLGTRCANLVLFPRAEDVPRGYAILSHTWSAEEDTFQKIQALNKKFDQTPSLQDHDLPRTREELNEVRSFLELAEKAGFEYAWVDTCCIDKTSSAELSEAINSMFQYYALSSACYVYLDDVNTDGIALTGPSPAPYPLWTRWHSRGWTLQELIASRVVVFFSSQWTPIGTKFELADILESATRIPSSVLRFQTSITDVSIAARMSWASTRETTRREDIAYCLFGIFGVNMPTLYGEGDNAFSRLLEAIMKTSRDASIFLW